MWSAKLKQHSKILNNHLPYQIVGTTWSNEASESMRIDKTIEAAMSTSLFGLFSAEFGISSTTGMDWSKTTAQDKSVTEEQTVEVECQPCEFILSLLSLYSHVLLGYLK